MAWLWREQPLWRVVTGNRKYVINRFPHSAHMQAMQASGFRVIQESVREDAALARPSLAPEFRDLTDQDLRAGSAFVLTQAQ